MALSNEPVVTAVCLCGHTGMEASQLGRSLSARVPDAVVLVWPDLCHGAGGLAAALSGCGAGRAVLGVCRQDFQGGPVQAELRRAGLDPLGAEVVHLGRPTGPGAMERSALLLAAAAARTHAFGGSGPAHARLALSARLSRRSLLRLQVGEYRPVPACQPDRCAAEAGCTACVTACPHGAVTPSGPVVALDHSRCTSCGLCVTACPTGAMVDPTATPAQLFAEVGALLDPEAGGPEPRAVLYTCRHDSTEAGDARPAPHPRWLPVRVPCVGMLPVAWLLAPLLLGAAAVGVLPCGQLSQGERKRLAGRVDYCQAWLRRLGGSPDRVQLASALHQLPPARPAVQPGGATQALFGPGGAAGVLLGLARAHAAPADVTLEHPYSPVGEVHIGPACTGCGRCSLACPTGALALEQDGAGAALTLAADRCTACYQCVPPCPERARGAIRIERRTDAGALAGGRRDIYRVAAARCEACGGPMAPGAMLERLAAALGSENAALSLVQRFCPDCRKGRLRL